MPNPEHNAPVGMGTGYEQRPTPDLTGFDLVHGRTTALVTCPFCFRYYRVSVWSFEGSGKRCACGAMLYRRFTLRDRSTEGSFLLTASKVTIVGERKR